ncbi:hypothetical protein Glove_476g84 [Diversispora epigaea]|uniref:Uncharacterized protein n=1 Tax=Diversispora epigaea TaxID=1348612 RepID=A0A397GKW0_9GLOM|nr:hypothetical protein Glove_476g84 [Diversispora epigaea]
MFCLFAYKSDPKELFAALHNLDEECREKASRLQEVSRLQELYVKCAKIY